MTFKCQITATLLVTEESTEEGIDKSKTRGHKSLTSCLTNKPNEEMDLFF